MSSIYVIADGADRVWTGTGWSFDYSAAQTFRSHGSAMDSLCEYVIHQSGTHSSAFVDKIDKEDWED